jgi:hypothetical protein
MATLSITSWAQTVYSWWDVPDGNPSAGTRHLPEKPDLTGVMAEQRRKKATILRAAKNNRPIGLNQDSQRKRFKIKRIGRLFSA